MRLILAAAIALTPLALPAQAQRLDTSRIDIKTKDGETSCGFNSYPGMTLTESETSKSVLLVLPAEGATADSGPYMTLMLQKGDRDWRHPMVLGIIVGGRGDAAFASGAVSAGRLSVDGSSGADLFATNREPPSFVLISDMTIDPTVYAMIDNSKRADLDLLDSKGGILRRYRWDTHRVSDAIETVSVVGWSCTTP